MALTIDGSDPTGDLGDLLASKLDEAGGKILQIVRATDGTTRSTTSTSFTDVTGMSVTITPQKNDSAILIVANFSTKAQNSTDNESLFFTRITDSSGNAISGAGDCIGGIQNWTRAAAAETDMQLTLIAYATPATTSATTYKLQFRSRVATTTIQVVNGATAGQLYAIEVSA